MKASLSVRWDKAYIIEDISPSILKLFEIENNAENVIGTPLSLPIFVRHLDLVRKSSIHYIEFLYSLNSLNYTVKIIQEKNSFTIYIESVFSNIKRLDSFPSLSIDDSFFQDIDDLMTNDKTISEIFAMRNASQENINLEILYVAKRMQENLTELKDEFKHIVLKYDDKFVNFEDDYIQKKEADIYFFLKGIGIKKLIILLLVLSFIESLMLEPFIIPLVEQIQDSITNIVDE